ncbi:LpxI family protein [Pseudooceanicola sp.]|uniref:LpxI family protein n=1 Tax=Pseudooceanicola sp. TaxID=1914328 RepID=UPI004059F0D6
MAGRLGLLAFRGGLPAAVLHANPGAYVVTFEGVEAEVPSSSGAPARFEKMGAVIKALKGAGVDRLVMAGGLARPPLDAKKLDLTTMAFAPKLMKALKTGDDGLLRAVIGFFEGHGLRVVGAHEVVPGLTAEPGLLAGPSPDKDALADAAKATEILTALAPLDLGQGAVVAGGLCLGIEALQGTDAMLAAVAATEPAKRPRARGVLVKLPKVGQDLRVDMPAIGPGTVQAAARAGLGGIVIAAGQVLLIEREALLATAEREGLFLLARAT